MKSEFNTSWNASVQKRKQRKYRFNAPLHIKHKFLSAHLSKELHKKYDKRSLPLRVGDEVLVMRGSSKKKRAKITSVNLRRGIVFLEGLQRTKRDGSKVFIPFNPRVLLIQSLNIDDKERISALQRKSSLSSSKEQKEQSNKIKQEK